MANPTVPFAAQVTLSYVQANEITANTFGLVKAAPFTGPELVSVANTIGEWAADVWMPELPATTILNTIEALGLHSKPFIKRNNTAGTPVSGGVSLPTEPTIITKTIVFGSGVADRSGRGGIRVPGVITGDIVNSRISSTRLAAWIAAWEALNGYLAAEGCVHCVISREHNKVPRSIGVTFTVTDYYVPHNVVGGQSTRLPGR